MVACRRADHHLGDVPARKVRQHIHAQACLRRQAEEHFDSLEFFAAYPLDGEKWWSWDSMTPAGGLEDPTEEQRLIQVHGLPSYCRNRYNVISLGFRYNSSAVVISAWPIYSCRCLLGPEVTHFQ